MSKLFISDLHLSAAVPKRLDLLQQFVDTLPTETTAVYILGDLFNFWIGDDQNDAGAEQVKKILRQLTSKCPVYLLPGNRDFFLGKRFTAETGCILLTDPCQIELTAQIKCILTHGDLLVTTSKVYRLFRYFTRLRWLQRLFLLLPQKWRYAIAEKLRAFSHRQKLRNQHKEPCIKPQLSTLKKFLRRFPESNWLIFGHVHQAQNKEITIDNKIIHYVSLNECRDTIEVFRF